jgi:hypothetical protein
MNDPKIRRAAIALILVAVTGLLVFLQRSNTNKEAAIEDSNPKEFLQLTNSSETALPALANLHSSIEIHRKAREQEIEKSLAAQRETDEENLRKEHWIKDFPYKPTFHPTLTHDPTRYDANNPATFRSDPEMEMAVKNHSYLVAFYNNPQIYSAEFQQLYQMLKSIDRADHPIITGKIFNLLIHYHKSCLNDSNASLKKMKYQSNATAPNELGSLKELRLTPDGKRTWGERAETYRNGIVGLLVLDKYWPDKEQITPDTARAFRDKLIEEIPSESLIKMQDVVELQNGQIGTFGYVGQTMRNLKPGDQLLYR